MYVHVMPFAHSYNKKDYDIVCRPLSTSKDPDERSLSPFFLIPRPALSPFKGASREFHCVENLWQFSKVYGSDLAHVDHEGQLTSAFRKWWERGAADESPRRYPAGKGRKPLFSVHGKLRLSYLAARKAIYVPQYANAIKDVDMFQFLRKEYRKGARILLLEYDARNIKNNLSFAELVDDPSFKMGHSYVLRESITNSDSMWYRKLII